GGTGDAPAGIPGMGSTSLTYVDTNASSFTGVSWGTGGAGWQATATDGGDAAIGNTHIDITGKSSVTVQGEATGGAGGQGAGTGHRGGHGATATGDARGVSTMGGTVNVSMRATAGNGGNGPTGGNGADATLVDDVSGSTSAGLTLTQTAIAGA